MVFLPLFQPLIEPLTQSNFTTTVISQHWIPEGWGPVAAYSLLISLLIVVLAYMIAEILRSPQLNAWAKSELYEFIVSALIIANLFFGLTILNTFVFYQTGGLDHFGLAQMYLDELIGAPTFANVISGLHRVGDITATYILLVFMDMVSGILGSFYAQTMVPSMGEFGILFPRIGFVPFGGLEQFVPSILTITDMVGVILMAMISQKALLTFFKESMFSIFLPLGVVLRAFPISRRLGATIIAIAITCYVVYPLTLVMNLGIYDSVPKYDLLENFNYTEFKGCLQGRECDSSADCCGAECNINGLCSSCPNQNGRCFTSRDCCGAPCVGGICSSCPAVGAACNTPDDCCGAPCESGTCGECIRQGNQCENDEQCCGLVCVHNPADSDPNYKTCQLFSPTGLFHGMNQLKNISDPNCNPPDPEFCNYNSDCTCSRQCIQYPDGQGRCAVPVLNQEDFIAIISPNNPTEITSPAHTAWWTESFKRGSEIKERLDPFNRSVIEYLIAPLAIPLLFFDIIENYLANLMWPVVAAMILAILDIIICITFFRSISEAIGGESSILGLSRAL